MNFKLEGYNECLVTYMAVAYFSYLKRCLIKDGLEGAIKSNATQYNIPVILITMALTET
jgi:hypothetical protein